MHDDMKLWHAINELDLLLAERGQHVREIVITPHLRPPMTLHTVMGEVLVLYGSEQASPWERAIAAKAGFDQAMRDADKRIKRLGRQLDAERDEAIAKAQREAHAPPDHAALQAAAATKPSGSS